jgi:hypothetical protein
VVTVDFKRLEGHVGVGVLGVHRRHRPDQPVDHHGGGRDVAPALLLTRRRRKLPELRTYLHQRVPRGDEPAGLRLDVRGRDRPALPRRLDCRNRECCCLVLDGVPSAQRRLTENADAAVADPVLGRRSPLSRPPARTDLYDHLGAAARSLFSPQGGPKRIVHRNKVISPSVLGKGVRTGRRRARRSRCVPGWSRRAW